MINGKVELNEEKEVEGEEVILMKEKKELYGTGEKEEPHRKQKQFWKVMCGGKGKGKRVRSTLITTFQKEVHLNPLFSLQLPPSPLLYFHSFPTYSFSFLPYIILPPSVSISFSLPSYSTSMTFPFPLPSLLPTLSIPSFPLALREKMT